jgi:hypothetical protein
MLASLFCALELRRVFLEDLDWRPTAIEKR